MTDYLYLPRDITFAEVAGSDRYLLRAGGRASYVSPLFRHIVLAMLEGAQHSSILDSINRSALLSQPIDSETLDQIISKRILPSLVPDKGAANGFASSIGFRLTLMTFAKHRWPLRIGKVFFKPAFLHLAFAFSALVSICFALAENKFLPSGENQFIAYVSIAGLLTLAGLLHELGHASAADYYGAVPGEIGIGLYLVLPVFYADVTNVWSLAPRQRVIVNLGGIYFQLLLNVALIGLFYLVADPTIQCVLYKTIFASLGLTILNLTPFLKFDGYWVYSDYFGIANLRKASVAQMVRICKGSAFRNMQRASIVNPLSIYTMGAAVFAVFFLIGLFGYLHSTGIGLFDMLTRMARSDSVSETWRSLSIGVIVNSAISAYFIKQSVGSALTFVKGRNAQ